MQKPLETIIVDDEASARRALKLHLQNVADFRIVAEAGNAQEALELIRGHRPDLVFLDIQMPRRDGFDVLRALRRRSLPAFVFLTGSDDYAIQAFKTNGLKYLLKPIDSGRVTEVLDWARQFSQPSCAKAHRRALRALLAEISNPAAGRIRRTAGRSAARPATVRRPTMSIRDGGRTTSIAQQDIEWIDAAGDYMCVHANGETHILRKTMKALEQELDAAILQRVHRSTIVNVRQVVGMKPHINGEYFLTLKCGHTIKLSRTYRNKLELIRPAGTTQPRFAKGRKRGSL